MTEYDVFGVRGLYTSLGDGWTYLNAHQCPQIPERVSAAVARSFRLSTAISPTESSGHHSTTYPAGTPESVNFLTQAKVAIADLVGGKATCVVLGPSLQVLYQQLARAARPLLRRGSTVVLSGLDAPELTSCFSDYDVRWAMPDLNTGELPEWQFEELVDGSTRLVSFAAAHDYLGSVVDVEKVADYVRDRSRAWVLVDASAVAAYRPIDITEWNADIVALNVGALGGPHLAALVFRDELMFNRLVSPIKGMTGPAALETPVSAGLAGAVSATVDHFAALTEATGSRREKLRTSMTALAGYMDPLRDDLYLFLSSLPAVHIIGFSGEAAASANQDRLPRLSFAVRGVEASTVHRRLVDNRLVTALAPHSPLMADMGVGDIGGAVTVGLGPFNTVHDINQLIRAVASLA